MDREGVVKADQPHEQLVFPKEVLPRGAYRFGGKDTWISQWMEVDLHAQKRLLWASAIASSLATGYGWSIGRSG